MDSINKKRRCEWTEQQLKISYRSKKDLARRIIRTGSSRRTVDPARLLESKRIYFVRRIIYQIPLMTTDVLLVENGLNNFLKRNSEISVRKSTVHELCKGPKIE
ncbi:hypothetical protein ACJJTC_009563 [Scirpophaga incertulas]